MKASGALVARLVRKCLREGQVVQIDGLGTFRPRGSSGFEFIPETRPRVFIAYVEEDLRLARKLCRELARLDLSPWLDKARLLPGQNWPRSIERAIEVSDFFVACFSRNSVSKRGYFNAELRYALLD